MRPIFVALIAFTLAAPSWAGLYIVGEFDPEATDRFVLDADEAGTPKELPFQQFRLLLLQLAALNNPDTEISRRYAERIDALRKQCEDFSPEQFAELTGRLVRLRRFREAGEYLQPALRDRRRASYFALAHAAQLAEIDANVGEPLDLLQTALTDYGHPKKVTNLTPGQLVFLKRVEREGVLKLYRLRQADRAAGRRGVADETDPIFPLGRDTANAVKWVGPSGNYEPGQLADAEKAKLPPDALAIVQQMVLWNPEDHRLLWLLGELYNARGEVDSAGVLFKELISEPRRYANPTLLARWEQIAPKMAAAPPGPVEKPPLTVRKIISDNPWTVSVGLALFALGVVWQVMVISRRFRPSGG